MGNKRNLLLNHPIHYNFNGKAACGTKSRKTATNIKYVTCGECRFEHWARIPWNHYQLAKFGRETMREIYDAMDEEDK